MLVDCLAELGVAPGPAGEVVAVVASLKPQIVNTAAVATR
jgi:hypothetical protein